jgi:starch phosphorylase
MPAFYDHDDAGIPRRWIGCMKASLITLSPEVGSGRMLREYVERLYAPAAHNRGGALSVEP